jgi:hypothetical protein
MTWTGKNTPSAETILACWDVHDDGKKKAMVIIEEVADELDCLCDLVLEVWEAQLDKEGIPREIVQ